MTLKRIGPSLEVTPGCLDFFFNSTPESPADCPRDRRSISLEKVLHHLLDCQLVFSPGPVASQKE